MVNKSFSPVRTDHPYRCGEFDGILCITSTPSGMVSTAAAMSSTTTSMPPAAMEAAATSTAMEAAITASVKTAVGSIEISMVMIAVAAEIVEAKSGIEVVVIIIVIIVAAWDRRVVPGAIGGVTGVVVIVCILRMGRSGKPVKTRKQGNQYHYRQKPRTHVGPPAFIYYITAFVFYIN